MEMDAMEMAIDERMTMDNNGDGWRLMATMDNGDGRQWKF